jgi:hypothetical protein
VNDRDSPSPPPSGDRRTTRLDVDAENVGKGLGQLVVALLDVVRQLLERQALRRVDSGTLDADEVERLGRALLALEQKFIELREVFGVGPDDLRLPVELDGLLIDEHPK